MERLPNLYHAFILVHSLLLTSERGFPTQVPGGTPHIEYHGANNRSLPLISRHPTEQMFRSFIEVPTVYDLNNNMEYVCDSSRTLHILAPPEPSSSRTLLLDIVQATQKRALLKSGNHCPSEYSGQATSSKSQDAFDDSRSPEEVNCLSRPPVHGFPRDCFSCSRPSPVGILRPIRDGEVAFSELTASKVVDGHGISQSQHKDLESALAGLEMENIVRGYFHSKTSTRGFSTHNPTSTERRALQAPPMVDSASSPSSQAECNTSSSQSGLSDRLPSDAASFTLSRPTVRRTPEGMGPADFNAIPKGKQQIQSAGGSGLSQGPFSLPCATPSEGLKSARTRPSTVTIDGSERRRPKRRRTRGDSTGETQRMTHIAVERNRRKQMNDHLSTLRDLMPSNFVQKTDQASIIGAAVEYVKELEVTLESLQSIQRARRAMAAILNPSRNRLTIQTRPTLSAAASYAAAGYWTPSLLSTTTSVDTVNRLRSRRPTMSHELFSIPEESRLTNEVDKVEPILSPVAKVEVRFLGEDAIVNISAQWKEKQIVEVIVAVESLFLTILHTSVNTVNNTVLYAFCAKVGPKCRMSANEIAAALHQIFNRQRF